jgi:hypothetical protein
MPEENNAMKSVLPDALEGLPDMKAEDMQVGRASGLHIACC